MDLFYWYSLSCFNEISDRRKYLLVEKFGGAREIFGESPETLSSTKIISLSKAKRLLNENTYAEGFKRFSDSGIGCCTINDSEYPDPLKDIYDPPVMLFYKGSIPQEGCMAIVGSRKCSSKGRAAAKNLSYALASKGATVASGMARGIDSCAHRGALSAGSTVAVLGCGVEICYPPENMLLKKEIEKCGCVLSEMPPWEKPTRYSFPRRNRIISGISKAVVVIEAGLGSGALITVDFAVDQGRDVYAVDWRGRIHSPGTEKIIGEGAMALEPFI